MGKNGYEHVNGRITSDQLGLRWISGITRWDTAKAVHTKPHKHPHMELIFCLRGELIYQIDGHGSVPVCEGSGIGIPRQTIHVLGGGTDSPCERIGLHIDTKSNKHPKHSIFSTTDIKSFCQTLSDMAGIPFRLDTNLQSSIRELSGYLKRSDPLTSAEQGLVRSLCCGILGIITENVTALQVQNTLIHDCTFGAAQLGNTDGATFLGCSVVNCPEPHFSLYGCTNFSWDGKVMDPFADFNVE